MRLLLVRSEVNRTRLLASSSLAIVLSCAGAAAVFAVGDAVTPSGCSAEVQARVLAQYGGAVGLSASSQTTEESKALPGDQIATPNQLSLGGTNEPTIAVNPLNPANIIAASLFSIRVSNDGGATFLAAVPAQVPGTHGLCGDSSVGFDSQGRLFWSYLGCAGSGLDIFIAQCNPATGAILAGYPINVTASPPINMPALGGFAHDKEWLAVDCFANSSFRDRLISLGPSSRRRAAHASWRPTPRIKA